MAVNPFAAGFACLCPKCGQGKLFTGYLKVAARCEVCGFDLRAADSGDGPAVFIILIVGFIACFGMLFTEIAYRPPIWAELTAWPIIGAGLCLVLLPPAKSLMLAMQFHNRAAEAGRADMAPAEPIPNLLAPVPLERPSKVHPSTDAPGLAAHDVGAGPQPHER
jgi:uncharacterized protein (DUF983 family)